MENKKIDIWAVSWALKNLNGIRSIVHAISIDPNTLCGCNIDGNESVEITQDLDTINCKICLNRLKNRL